MQHPIMTFEEYAKSRHDAPYIFEIEKGNKKITYFGAAHSQDPADPMFAEIEKKFKKSNPDIVFVEGIGQLEKRRPQIIRMVTEWSRNEAIKKMGESGFALQLAIESGIDAQSPEPEFADEIAHVIQQNFSRENIFAHYLYRQIEQYYRMLEKPAPDTYLEPHLREFQNAAGWQGFDYSFKNLQAIGKRIWGDRGNFQVSDISRTDPTPWDNIKNTWTVVNQIAQQSSCFRDQYIVQRIEDVLKEKDRLLIVFGASHAYMQEPAIHRLFEEL